MSMVALRRLERVQNLQMLISLRDGPGGSPAADAVRLKACAKIEPKSFRQGLRKAAAPAIGLNAGYIIRIPATDPPDDPDGI
jgi:hypothetical protein